MTRFVFERLPFFPLCFVLLLLGCQRPVERDDFPTLLQEASYDCGAACLQMITEHYGKSIGLDSLKALSDTDTIQGASLLGISDAAEAIGFKTLAVKIPLTKLIQEAPLPFIAPWQDNHFIVIYKVSDERLWIADPAQGKIDYSLQEFIEGWDTSEEEGISEGVVLLLETTDQF